MLGGASTCAVVEARFAGLYLRVCWASAYGAEGIFHPEDFRLLLPFPLLAVKCLQDAGDVGEVVVARTAEGHMHPFIKGFLVARFVDESCFPLYAEPSSPSSHQTISRSLEVTQIPISEVQLSQR